MLMTCLCLSMSAYGQSSTQIIERNGWDYDRASLEWPQWVDVQKEKKQGALRGSIGYTEFDVQIPTTGWYELWEGGVPVEWSRSLYVDGKPMFVETIGSPDDVLPLAERRKQKLDFKEINLFLEAGKHTLRFERLGFPGVLPSKWQLRPSSESVSHRILGQVVSPRIVNPGQSVTLEITSSSPKQTNCQIILHEIITGQSVNGPEVELKTSEQPVTQKVEVQLPKSGLYLVTALIDGKKLRPADMKIGYVMATTLEKEKDDQTTITKLSLNGLFTDGVVLQRDKPLPIWGLAPTGQTVTVTLADQSQTTTANEQGHWKVTFKPLSAGGPHTLVATCDTQKITRKDVLVGEVWLLSGQSNMGGPILQCIGGKDAASQANMPNVRLGFVYPNGEAGQMRDVGWMKAVAHDGNPAHVKRWIAIHFAFAKKIHETLNVPVGLIAANRGGTLISTWVPEETAQTDPAYKGFNEQFWEYNAPANRQNRYIVKLVSEVRKWKSKYEKAPADKKPTAPKLRADMSWRNRPGQHYHGLIQPSAPFAMRGVLWYQGESDSKMSAIYPAKFKRLMADWRKAWDEPKLPFITVQISYGSGRFDDGQPGVEFGAEMRQMQLECAKLPDTYMVVSHDLMRPEDNVHYLDKLPVGDRLALAALAEIYGKDIVYQGPMFEKISVDNHKAILHFSHTHGGLKVKGETLNGFSIAGADRQWHWAKAHVDGQTVIVQSDAVAKPVAVRYGWSGYRNANLFNGAGLPAPTFRTDDWPLASDGNEFTSSD